MPDQNTKRRMETYAKTKLQPERKTLDPYGDSRIYIDQLPEDVRTMISDVNKRWDALDRALEPHHISLRSPYDDKDRPAIVGGRLFRTEAWNLFHRDLTTKLEQLYNSTEQDIVRAIWNNEVEDFAKLDELIARAIEMRAVETDRILAQVALGPNAAKRKSSPPRRSRAKTR